MARDNFREPFGIRDTSTGAYTLLAGLEVRVYQPGTTTAVNIYSNRTTNTPINQPIVTDGTGVVNFWAEPGDYDIAIHDQISPNRIADQTFGWVATVSRIDVANLTDAALTALSNRGTLGNRPAANTVRAGQKYFAYDDKAGVEYRSTGSAWEAVGRALGLRVTAAGALAASVSGVSFATPAAGNYLIFAQSTGVSNISTGGVASFFQRWTIDGNIMPGADVVLKAGPSQGARFMFPFTTIFTSLSAGNHTLAAQAGALASMDGNDTGSYIVLEIS